MKGQYSTHFGTTQIAQRFKKSVDRKCSSTGVSESFRNRIPAMIKKIDSPIVSRRFRRSIDCAVSLLISLASDVCSKYTAVETL